MKGLLFLVQFIVLNTGFSNGKDTLSPKADSLFSSFLRMNYKTISKMEINTLNVFDSLYPFDKVFYSKGKAWRSIRYKVDASCIYVDSVFRINNCLLISGKHLGFAGHDFILIYDLQMRKHEIYYLIPQETGIIERINLIRTRVNW